MTLGHLMRKVMGLPSCGADDWSTTAVDLGLPAKNLRETLNCFHMFSILFLILKLKLVKQLGILSLGEYYHAEQLGSVNF